jgi:hypothetical protein
MLEIFSTYFHTKDKEDLIESLMLIYQEEMKLNLSTNKIELSSDDEEKLEIPQETIVTFQKRVPSKKIQ